MPLDPSEMTAEEQARPPTTLQVLATERPDLQGIGLKVAQAYASSPTTLVYASWTQVPGTTVTYTVNSPESVVRVDAVVDFEITADIGDYARGAVFRDWGLAGQSLRENGLIRLTTGRITVPIPVLDTGLAAGTYTWSIAVQKHANAGAAQALASTTRTTALLIDR